MPGQNQITIPMLARLLGVSRITVYKRVKRGEIPATRVGRMYVINDRTVRDIIGGEVSSLTKQQIDSAVHKTMSEYGDLLKQLGSE